MEIKFENVTFIINKKTPLEKTILSDVSFNINKPGIYSFIGASNSGKTCIGELIDALIKPTKGVVKVGDFLNDGKRIANVNKLRFDVGYVFKNPYDMFINSTVKSEIEFGMKYFKYKLEKIDMRATDALKMVGLDETFLDVNPETLCLSDAKKVSLASVIVFNPKILILDEPTIGLNYKEKKDLMLLLRRLRDKYKKTIIILTKDTNFIYPIVDYVYVMNRTKLVCEGGSEVLKETQLLETIGIEVPKIIKFIELANKKKADLEDYKELKDLLKGVYRNVF